MRAIVIPVLEDAFDRSLLLAASMDARGYGRTGDRSRLATWVTGGLLVTGLGGICVGVYALLDATVPRILAGPLLVVAMGVGLVGIAASGLGVRRSSYRPDRWRVAELVAAGSGLAAGAIVALSSRVDPASLNPSLSPLTWPPVPVVSMLGVLVALLPAFATPLPENPAADEPVAPDLVMAAA